MWTSKYCVTRKCRRGSRCLGRTGVVRAFPFRSEPIVIVRKSRATACGLFVSLAFTVSEVRSDLRCVSDCGHMVPWVRICIRPSVSNRWSYILGRLLCTHDPGRCDSLFGRLDRGGVQFSLSPRILLVKSSMARAIRRHTFIPSWSPFSLKSK